MTVHQEISRPDKVLFPDRGWTKADVAGHYECVADVLLPHLAGRPLVVHRFPDGVDDAGFYQKQAAPDAPVATATVAAQNERGSVDDLLVDDMEGLRYLANLAAIELHRWLSRADAIDEPDLLVMDLDPPPRADLAVLRYAARATLDLFGELGLTPFVIATGGSGYHVVAPLDRRAGFDDVRALARAVADRLAEDAPDDLTTQQRIAKRGNRIFLDTNRNAYGQTAVAPTRCGSGRARRWPLRSSSPSSAGPRPRPTTWHRCAAGWTARTTLGRDVRPRRFGHRRPRRATPMSPRVRRHDDVDTTTAAGGGSRWRPAP